MIKNGDGCVIKSNKIPIKDMPIQYQMDLFQGDQTEYDLNRHDTGKMVIVVTARWSDEGNCFEYSVIGINGANEVFKECWYKEKELLYLRGMTMKEVHKIYKSYNSRKDKQNGKK